MTARMMLPDPPGRAFRKGGVLEGFEPCSITPPLVPRLGILAREWKRATPAAEDRSILLTPGLLPDGRLVIVPADFYAAGLFIVEDTQ